MGFTAYLVVGGLLFLYIYIYNIILIFIYYVRGSTSSCLLLSFLLLSTRYVRYLMVIWRMVFIVFFINDVGYVGSQEIFCFLCDWLPSLLR